MHAALHDSGLREHSENDYCNFSTVAGRKK